MAVEILIAPALDPEVLVLVKEEVRFSVNTYVPGAVILRGSSDIFMSAEWAESALMIRANAVGNSVLFGFTFFTEKSRLHWSVVFDSLTPEGTTAPLSVRSTPKSASWVAQALSLYIQKSQDRNSGWVVAC